MMHGHVARLAVASVLALTTACPLDPGEETTTGNETGDDSTGGTDPTAVTVTSPSTTAPSTSSPSTTAPSTTDATETMTTDVTATESTTDEPTSTTDESGSSSSGGPIVGTPATIPEIQQGDVDEDTAVEITDAITTAIGFGGFFMQDAAGGEWSGIWVYVGDDGEVPALGDVVTVVGVYEEFYDLSQIDATGGGSMVVTDSPGEGNVPAPEALAITDLGESWESVFVRVADDTFTVQELSDVKDVNEFRVENEGGDSIWVDDFMYDVVEEGDLAGFGVGATFDAIQGPLNFTFDEFKIAPRTVDDLSNYMAP
jgi:predicted extracellular nuclease